MEISCTVGPLERVSHVSQQWAQVLRGCAHLFEASAPRILWDRLATSLQMLDVLGEVCYAPVATSKTTALGCMILYHLGCHLFLVGLNILQRCLVGSEQDCVISGKNGSKQIIFLLRSTELAYRNAPIQGLVSVKLVDLQETFFHPLRTTHWIRDTKVSLPPAWTVANRAIDSLRYWAEDYIWRELHWIWLMDSLASGEVVHTAWGPPEIWKMYGANEAHVVTPLKFVPAPLYLFSERRGTRAAILSSLLQNLYEDRGRPQQLWVVEVGVFTGQLAEALLQELSFVHLLGIDPYIGRDGTFPGNFSQTLDPRIAMRKALSVMRVYRERATLISLTSESAATLVTDGSVDALFIDGCHRYECVRRDLIVWLPKLRRGVPTLVSGHDFSPQWPGVVRAVHEHRAGGLEVNLASDWMYWWLEHFDNCSNATEIDTVPHPLRGTTSERHKESRRTESRLVQDDRPSHRTIQASILGSFS